MRPREPRPRVDLIRLDAAAAPPPSGHRREGRGEAFGGKYQAFSRQSEPSEQRLVEHKDRWHVRVRSERRILVTERLSREPDSAHLVSALHLSRPGGGCRVEVGTDSGRCRHRCEHRVVSVPLNRARLAKSATCTETRCSPLNLGASESIGKACTGTDSPLPAEPVGCSRTVEQVGALRAAGRSDARGSTCHGSVRVRSGCGPFSMWGMTAAAVRAEELRSQGSLSSHGGPSALVGLWFGQRPALALLGTDEDRVPDDADED